MINHLELNSKILKELNSDILIQTVSIYNGFQNCGRKITQAAKFIDFFVHDILDYTLLNKNEVGFVKIMEVFDIRECVSELLMILSDKAEMRKIKFNTKYVDFNNDEIKIEQGVEIKDSGEIVRKEFTDKSRYFIKTD